MGFTGSKAAQWKEAYIDAFNQMEATINAPAINPDNLISYQRIILRFDGNGAYTAKAIPNDAYVLTLDEIVRAVGCPNDLPFRTAQLAQLITGAASRLHCILAGPVQVGGK
jgi:hypothetical protein